MGILSGGLGSILSPTTSSFFLPQIQTLPSRTPWTTMCLKQHHNNKLKLLVTHRHEGSLCFSLLSTEEEEDDNRIVTTFIDPCFRWPVAGCNELLLKPMGYDLLEPALWNPSTKEVIKTLPRPPRPPPTVQFSEQVHLYGLGLDPKTSDYKVIRYLEFSFRDRNYTFWKENYGLLAAELYSLKTNSWKRVAYPHTNVLPEYLTTPIYINGFNYWKGCAGTCLQDFVIISFDFSKECFSSALIPGPCAAYKINTKGFCEDEAYHFILVEFEGSLAVVIFLALDNLFELWVWNNDDESWSRRGEWTISVSAAGVHVRRPLGLFKDHQFYFEDSMGEIVLFDCAKHKLKNLGVFVDHPSDEQLYIFPIVE